MVLAPTPQERAHTDPGLWREALHECLALAERYATVAAIHVELGEAAATQHAMKSLAACVRTAEEIYAEFGH